MNIDGPNWNWIPYEESHLKTSCLLLVWELPPPLQYCYPCLICLMYGSDILCMEGGCIWPGDTLSLTLLYGCTKTIPLHLWESHGISRLGLLYQDNVLRSFSDLAMTFNLPKTFSFQYLQIRPILQHCTWTSTPLHF